MMDSQGGFCIGLFTVWYNFENSKGTYNKSTISQTKKRTQTYKYSFKGSYSYLMKSVTPKWQLKISGRVSCNSSVMDL